MAYRLLREFRQASTRLDTPPFSNRHHLVSAIAQLRLRLAARQLLGRQSGPQQENVVRDRISGERHTVDRITLVVGCVPLCARWFGLCAG